MSQFAPQSRMSVLRCEQPGYEQLYQHDQRRGVWLRVVLDANAMTPTRIDLCSGREGDDEHLTLEVGQTITVETLHVLADIIRYGKDAKAALDPPYCICEECGKEVPFR